MNEFVPWKGTIFKRKFIIFQPSIFKGYVSFQWGKPSSQNHGSVEHDPYCNYWGSKSWKKHFQLPWFIGRKSNKKHPEHWEKNPSFQRAKVRWKKFFTWRETLMGKRGTTKIISKALGRGKGIKVYFLHNFKRDTTMVYPKTTNTQGPKNKKNDLKKPLGFGSWKWTVEKTVVVTPVKLF